jgi:hypothetical protein
VIGFVGVISGDDLFIVTPGNVVDLVGVFGGDLVGVFGGDAAVFVLEALAGDASDFPFFGEFSSSVSSNGVSTLRLLIVLVGVATGARRGGKSKSKGAFAELFLFCSEGKRRKGVFGVDDSGDGGPAS